MTADSAALERVGNLRSYVASRQRSALWRDGWNRRVPPARSAARVALAIIDDMATAVASGDAASIDSREKWLRRFVTGEAFDSTPPVRK